MPGERLCIGSTRRVTPRGLGLRIAFGEPRADDFEKMAARCLVVSICQRVETSSSTPPRAPGCLLFVHPVSILNRKAPKTHVTRAIPLDPPLVKGGRKTEPGHKDALRQKIAPRLERELRQLTMTCSWYFRFRAIEAAVAA